MLKTILPYLDNASMIPGDCMIIHLLQFFISGFIINSLSINNNISLHFPSNRAIMSDKRGACREQAENRLYRLDPKPDLDNANVGIYHTQHIFLCCLFTDIFGRICPFSFSGFVHGCSPDNFCVTRRHVKQIFAIYSGIPADRVLSTESIGEYTCLELLSPPLIWGDRHPAMCWHSRLQFVTVQS